MAFTQDRPTPVSLDGGADVGVLMGLPVGNYLVMAKVQLDLPDSADPALVECTLGAGTANTATDRSAVVLSTFSTATATVPLSLASEITGGVVVLNCSGAGASASRMKLTAIQVQDLLPVP